jgi:16S rRNA (cytosine967-C5)-methyltransferase
VRTRDSYANLALPAILRRYRLRDRDAALATELGYGTLRAQGLLDAVIEECTDRPMSRVEPGLLDALRLGAYQLLRTRIPPHAAVATTVELVRGEAGSRAGGFVNAVLRRVSAHPLDGWIRLLAPDPLSDPHGFAAVAHAHPRWVVDAFAEALGEILAEAATDLRRPA